MVRKARPYGRDALEIYEVYEYGDGLEQDVTTEVIQLLRDPERDKRQENVAEFPQKTLGLVDELVRHIEIHRHRPPSFWGAKFSLEECTSSDIPFGKPKSAKLLRHSPTALNFYEILRAFYALLCTPEYGALKYCVSIEAARHALLSVYPTGFIELPPIGFPRPDNVSEFEFRKGVTELVWPTVERYNQAIQLIAEIVSGNEYRSKRARELFKLRLRANSVSSLINGLLNHHTRLVVVALRFSIRQASALDYMGDRMAKAFNRLIGDRRGDAYLKQAVGYFWVLQESFKVSLRKRLRTIGKQGVNGGIALHYDLVLFFDVGLHNQTDAIGEHISERWRKITDGAGGCRALTGASLSPYSSGNLISRMEKVGRIPDEQGFVGVVTRDSARARNLLKVAKTMVFSAALRKQGKHSTTATLIKDNTRRFGKSDLRTGCGYDKEGRGAKKGKSGVTYERKKRP
ncbi:hypothetical protein QZM38_15660 [Burkholderia orbicola]|uniref:hypothetical protein n=1 Tax=Burkholderia orbicola TaxID=2978683 RepID=UPI00264AC10F|nr:hypothetical protein [Burkholderia orbicola]MDN7482269.1 hypothetical protein [Burkholderia orbicola]